MVEQVHTRLSSVCRWQTQMQKTLLETRKREKWHREILKSVGARSVVKELVIGAKDNIFLKNVSQVLAGPWWWISLTPKRRLSLKPSLYLLANLFKPSSFPSVRVTQWFSTGHGWDDVTFQEILSNARRNFWLSQLRGTLLLTSSGQGPRMLLNIL